MNASSVLHTAALAESLAARGSNNAATPPPPNEAHDPLAAANGAANDDAERATRAAPVVTLNHLNNLPAHPCAERCLAHLRLLFAMRRMRVLVGCTDGLWGLCDVHAEGAVMGESVPAVKAQNNLEAWLRIHEKRWGLFVARAVDRYEAWWKWLARRHATQPAVSVRDIDAGDAAYRDFPVDDEGCVVPWTEDMLPPLDVLMVWHTHMLNPRAFLEDAMLAGIRPIWVSGLPWELVNKAIDGNFNYTVSVASMAAWVRRTNRSWDNAADIPFKKLSCPRCCSILLIPWTTCLRSKHDHASEPLVLTGTGYGDSDFSFVCRVCETTINKRLLSAARVVQEEEALFGQRNRPISGTGAVLDPISGRPKEFAGQPLPAVSRVAERTTTTPRDSENHGLFAVELCGSVKRQAVFADKMWHLNWLHAPSALLLMARLIHKYRRFLDIIRQNPSQAVVPTLDVDLAWHTHQLCPSRYYRYTVEQTGCFIDHDNNVDAGELAEHFNRTSKVYQERYGEVYGAATTNCKGNGGGAQCQRCKQCGGMGGA